MLISKEVEVRWNGYTRKWYEEKGYEWTKANDYFCCKIEDLMPTSTVKVLVMCDYCNKVFKKQYRYYFTEREVVDKNCCSNRKCMVAKSKEVSLIRYGVTSYAQTEESKEYNRNLYKTPFTEVVEYCNNKGLDLLSNESDYKNDRSRLKVICNYHPQSGVQDTCFANIKKNKHCCELGGTESTANHRRLDGELVYQDFIDSGLIPQFNPDDYQNNLIPLPYLCPEHINEGTQYRVHSVLKYAEGCYYCSRERAAGILRLDQNVVFGEFKNKGLYPIKGEKYINKDISIDYICEKHPGIVQSTTYSSFRVSRQCCECCRKEENVSSLNRQLRSCIDKWKEDSKRNCGYKCVFTDDTDYQIHHLYSFNEIIKDALKILSIEIKDSYSGQEIVTIKEKVVDLHYSHPLGVCIRTDLHILFHQLYSKSANTPEQFEEFKTRYHMGEFDEILASKI